MGTIAVLFGGLVSLLAAATGILVFGIDLTAAFEIYASAIIASAITLGLTVWGADDLEDEHC